MKKLLLLLALAACSHSQQLSPSQEETLRQTRQLEKEACHNMGAFWVDGQCQSNDYIKAGGSIRFKHGKSCSEDPFCPYR